MSLGRPILKVFLDEGVPESVGRTLAQSGHDVIYFKDAAVPGSPDQLVAAVSEANDAILVTLDGDFRKIAQRRGIGRRRFRRLSLIKLSCRETKASARMELALSLVELEWNIAASKSDRRMFVDIGNDFIRTSR